MNTDLIRSHTVILTERKRIELTGVHEVESFLDTGIVLSGVSGDISIEGENLKIESFSVETGKISITGTINALVYFEQSKLRSTLFKKRKS